MAIDKTKKFFSIFSIIVIIFTVVSILSIASSNVEAKKAAYIYRNSNNVNQKILSIMTDMNFTVDLVYHTNANNTNFTQYDFIYAGNEYFSNPLDIPVNKMPALIMNSYNIKSWSWSASTSTIGQTSPLQVKVQDSNHIITQGLPSYVPIYSTCCYGNGLSIPVTYLSRFDKSPYLKVITSTLTNNNDATIATAVNNTNLLYGKKASAKGVFFGIFETAYWTADSETLFRNSVRWLTADEAPPIINITSPLNTTYNTNNISLEFTVSEPVLWCGYAVDSGATNTLSNPSQNMSTTFIAAEGAHQIIVRCNDTMNNQGQASVGFFVDAIPPSINIISPQSTTYTNSSVLLNTATDSSAFCSYSLNGNANQTLAGNGTDWTAVMTAIEGSNSVIVWCRDSAQNWNSASRNFAVDTLPPVITLTSPANANYAVNVIPVMYITNEPSSCRYNLDNSGFSAVSGNTTITVLEGLHSFLFECTDLYSHTSNVQVNFSVTTTPPNAPVNLTANYNTTNGNVYLTWRAPTGGADSYDIYSSSSPNISTFNFSSPVASTTSLQWQDNSASLTQQKYYIVRAKNSAGVEESNTFRVGKFDIAIYQGMNLVSLPLIPKNSSIISVLHQSPANYPVIEISGRKMNGQYEIVTFYPDFPPGYWWSADNFYTLENGRGYWLKSTADYNFTLTGEVLTQQQTQIYDGMNLVGWTSVSSKKLWEAIKQNATNFTIIEISSRKQNNQYDIATFYPENPPNYWWSADSFDTLVPGKGYWFKATANSTWTYSSE